MPSSSPTPPLETAPQVDILESIQRNVFPDVIAATIGLRILGSVFKQRPDLNKPELYSLVSFGKDTSDWQDFSVHTAFVGEWNVTRILSNYDKIVECITRQLEGIIGLGFTKPSWAVNSKIVHGTVRLHVEFTDNGLAQFILIWVEHTMKE